MTFALVMAVACAEKPQPSPARQPVGILYVAVPELAIHQQPDAQSPVVAMFREGESVSVYAMRGDWAEIQLFDSRSGWARQNGLTAVRDAGFAGTTAPTFRRPPSPVWTQKKVRGEIVLEASVDTEGNVLSVRTVSNTTGDAALAAQNRAELSSAKFYPLIREGRATPFVYEYRATY